MIRVIYNMNVVLSISLLVFLLVHTNFIAEYLKLFGMRRFLWRFTEWEKDNRGENLIIYWNDKYNNFITRLLCCGVCLSTVISLIYSIITRNLFHFLTLSYESVFCYFILAVLYKLLNKLY